VSSEQFNIGYANADVYEDILPPHYYQGTEDVDLIAALLHDKLGPPPTEPTAQVLDLGCGPGRITTVLAPYAAALTGTDKSVGMIGKFERRFPTATARCEDTETIVHALHTEGRARTFDIIGAFWSMSYPLLECFEDTTADGVVVTTDPDTGRRRAERLIDHLVTLLAPGGHLIMLFFDAHTAEQRLVTKLWERIAPFPGTGRDYTWRLLEQGLLDAEARGHGILHHTRLPGVAVAESDQAARDWFLTGHLNSYAGLSEDPEVHQAIADFTAQHRQPDGRIMIPSGVHLVHFHALGHHNLLPTTA